jgi:hypothetical protein
VSGWVESILGEVNVLAVLGFASAMNCFISPRDIANMKTPHLNGSNASLLTPVSEEAGVH